jgi:raffinose/stachyose/melibiose transport system substrate-binding protein
MKKSTKIITAMLMLVAMVTMVVGCGSQASDNSKAQTEKKNEKKVEEKKEEKKEDKKEEAQEIRVVTYFTGQDAWAGPFQEAVKLFEEKYPNIKVKDESTPTQGEALRTKVRTDFASGNEPDVCMFFTGVDTIPLLESGKVVPWDEYLEADKEWAKNFAPAAMKSVEYEGKVYALPYIGFYEGLMCNKDLFDKYNIKIPTNYDELLTAIEEFKKNDIIPLATGFVDPRYLWECITLSVGGQEGHLNAYDSSWVDSLNIIKELYEKEAFPKDCMTLTDEACRQLFNDKKAAMILNGSWVTGGCKDQENTFVTYTPVMKNAKGDYKDIVSGFGSGWYMSKELNDKKNDAPLKFIKFMTSPETMGLFEKIGGVPAVKCKSSAPTPAKESGYAMVNGAKSTSIPTDGFLTPDAFNTINEGIAYVVTGKKTPEQLLEESKKLNKK